jgi:hypothetical protein
MRNARAPSLIACTCLFSNLIHAACTLPAVPSKTPDGATANDGEMRAAMAAMSHYETDTSNYLKCLDFEAEQRRLSAEEAARLKSAALGRHQAAIARFNAQMRLYMER